MHADLFDQEARAAIEAHLPPTWPIGEVPSNVVRDGLVAKQVFGREGHEVFFGEDCSPEAVATLMQRQTYVAQARVQVASVRGGGADVARAGCRRRLPDGRLFRRRWPVGGLYTRFGDKITTSRSKWLATFAEPDSEPQDG